MAREKSKEEHMYTSTGMKFWCHPEQMQSYREQTGQTIISTHISPTSKCNLNCGYCSVKKRERQFEIEMPVIQQYVRDLKSRGLKAVIFTGGGEPLMYDQFNNLVRWVKGEGLETALITNGTVPHRVEDDVWADFSWVRVSMNRFPGWENKIGIPSNKTSSDCVVGASLVYTGQSTDELRKVEEVAQRFGARYIRILPNCLFDQEALLGQHREIDQRLAELGKSLFFHQFKIHGSPKSTVCHQSKFRPYLSEVDGGTVYPCDSLVLNNSGEAFDRKYQICKAADVLKFLDGEIAPKFSPEKDCDGCVFTENVEMLGEWKKTGNIPERFAHIDPKLIRHANFP